MKRRGKTFGSKSFTMAAGTTKTVFVKLKRASFRKLQRQGSRRANAVLSGTDSSGSPLAAKQAVRLLKART